MNRFLGNHVKFATSGKLSAIGAVSHPAFFEIFRKHSVISSFAPRFIIHNNDKSNMRFSNLSNSISDNLKKQSLKIDNTKQMQNNIPVAGKVAMSPMLASDILSLSALKKHAVSASGNNDK